MTRTFPTRKKEIAGADFFDVKTKKAAEILGYAYPYEAEKCAQKYINR